MQIVQTITATPAEVVRSFLHARGTIGTLVGVIGPKLVRRVVKRCLCPCQLDAVLSQSDLCLDESEVLAHLAPSAGASAGVVSRVLVALDETSKAAAQVGRRECVGMCV